MRTLVAYRSISGFTKKYATWIAEELEADIRDVRQLNVAELDKYHLIIFGGSLHATGINGVKIIKENLPKLSDKKIIVFAVGASPPRENVFEEVKNRNFSIEEQKKIAFFYLRGGFNYSKLNFTNKLLMLILKVRLRMKKDKTSDEKGMLTAYANPIDCTKKENIKQITEYVKSLV